MKGLIIGLAIVVVLVVGFLVAASLGVFQRNAQPDPSDACYGINVEILDCSYSVATNKVQANLKLNSGRIERLQGLISGKILGNSAGSGNISELNWEAPYQKIVEFSYDKTVDGVSLDNFEGPYTLQIRPIIEGKQCIQFDTKRCSSE